MTAFGDIYDEEFNRNLVLAKQLIREVKKKKDREICTKWISKLCALKSGDPLVKKNRNHFFKYMLNVLRKGLNEQPEAHFGYPQYDDKYANTDVSGCGGKGYMCRWSADKKTYVAAKPMPGRGALVYMAVAKDPSLGWEKPQKKMN